MNPEQVRVLTIADRHNEFAQKVVDELCKADIRAEMTLDAESLNKKVRDAQLAQVNYIVVIGDKEVETDAVNVRTRTNKILGTMTLDMFKAKLLEEIKSKTLPEKE